MAGAVFRVMVEQSSGTDAGEVLHNAGRTAPTISRLALLGLDHRCIDGDSAFQRPNQRGRALALEGVVATLITGAGDIPPDMILLPDGHRMQLDEFYREHGDDLRPYADAKVIVVTPGLKIPAELEDAERAVVGLIAAAIVGAVTRNAKLTAWLAPVMAALVQADTVRWINHQIEHGRIVRIYTIRELFLPLDKQRLPQSDLISQR